MMRTTAVLTVALLTVAATREASAQGYYDPHAATAMPVEGAPPPQHFYFHEGPYLQLRTGAGWAVRSQYTGLGFGPLLEVGGGFTSRIGLSVGANLGVRYHGTPNFGLFDTWVGAQVRYAGIPRSYIHPFGEFGFYFHLPIDTHNPGPAAGITDPPVRFQIGYGAHLAGGVQFDLTPNVSLDLGMRFDLFTNASQSVNTLYFAFAPYLGLMFFR